MARRLMAGLADGLPPLQRALIIRAAADNGSRTIAELALRARDVVGTTMASGRDAAFGAVLGLELEGILEPESQFSDGWKLTEHGLRVRAWLRRTGYFQVCE